MQREVLSWVFTGIAVVIVLGLCVVLRPRTEPKQPLRPTLPNGVSPVPIRGDASAYTFSNDEQRVYFARHDGATIESREYTIAIRAERTLVGFQVPNGLSVSSISIGRNGQVIALLTTDSESQSTRTRVVVIPPRGRAKTITHRLVKDCSVEAIAENGAAIAGHYTRTVRRLPLLIEPKQYQIPAPYIEQPITDGFRVSEPYHAHEFAESVQTPEELGNAVSRRPYYPVIRSYTRYRTDFYRYRTDFYGGGGGPPPPYWELHQDPFTCTEQYLFCSVRGRIRNVRVDWSGNTVVIGVSASGNTVAGNYYHKDRQRGFIWRTRVGVSTLSYPGSQQTQLFWLSPQGDTALGLAAISDTKTLLFRWNRRGGYKCLGEIPENIESVSVPCVAPNGQAVLLEQSAYYSDRIYFVWSERLGFRKSQRLGDMLTKPLCISNSGKQILAKTNWGVSFVKVE